MVWCFSGANKSAKGGGNCWTIRRRRTTSVVRRISALLRRVIAQEYQIVRFGLFGVVAVALDIELLEGGRVVDALFDDKTAHHPAGLLGVEADDLVLAVFQVLELGINDACVQGAACDRREVLLDARF